eukprot:3214943-Amphidinium_carterae.1
MVVRYSQSQSRRHSGSLVSRSTAPRLSKLSDRHSGFQVKPNLSDCSAQFSRSGFWMRLSKHVCWVHICVNLLH